jgi:hypothetical protein
MKLTTLIACTLILGSAQAAEIPTSETPIYLAANARPVEVSEGQLHRYRCEQGRMVATNEGSGAARTSTRRLTLRCITA